MQWTDLVGHLNLSAVFTHRVLKSELIGLMNIVAYRLTAKQGLCKQWLLLGYACNTHSCNNSRRNYATHF
jgi:hypothetical protein